ncbi:hypothetical protein DLM_2948 [Aquitalea magnusonii]|uniref:Uncharacterized protein n=1 Tax=Aquitalea magnusonii TaxID=332411 RepID=A0A3G9GIP0_9NEIS|nr:hypothetical protein DLM_2948 [Aquitalea magnusonii]
MPPAQQHHERCPERFCQCAPIWPAQSHLQPGRTGRPDQDILAIAGRASIVGDASLHPGM